MDVQMSNCPGVFKVSGKLFASKFFPSIAAKTDYAARVAMDLHPSFEFLVRAEGFRF